MGIHPASDIHHERQLFTGEGHPNQLHMYGVCLSQPLGSGIKQSLNLGSESRSQQVARGYRAQKQPSHPALPALVLTPHPLKAAASSTALGMGEPPALARVQVGAEVIQPFPTLF